MIRAALVTCSAPCERVGRRKKKKQACLAWQGAAAALACGRRLKTGRGMEG